MYYESGMFYEQSIKQLAKQIKLPVLTSFMGNKIQLYLIS